MQREQRKQRRRRRWQLELKSVEAVTRTHKRQVLTYLRLKHKAVGLLINFNVEHLRDGSFRIIDPRRDLSEL